MKAFVACGAARYLPALCLLTLALLWAGCSSTKALWNSRIGVYTFDQAVMELGPPDKAATLKDGTMVAEWLTRRGRPGGFYGPYDYYYHPPPYSLRYRYHWGPPLYYYDPPSPDYFLRLTFAADGRLQAWQRGAR
jgi:hypothetical protein